jgi:hypothetical protein
VVGVVTTVTAADVVTVLLPLVEVTVIVDVPAATAVNNPLLSMVAIVGALEEKVVVAPTNATLFWSKGVAVNVNVPVTIITDEDGVTTTLVKIGGGVVAVTVTVTFWLIVALPTVSTVSKDGFAIKFVTACACASFVPVIFTDGIIIKIPINKKANIFLFIMLIFH